MSAFLNKWCFLLQNKSCALAGTPPYLLTACRQDAEFLNVTAGDTNYTVTTGLCTVYRIILRREKNRIFLLHTNSLKGIRIFLLSISFLFPPFFLLSFHSLLICFLCLCSFYISSTFIEFLDSFLLIFCLPSLISK